MTDRNGLFLVACAGLSFLRQVKEQDVSRAFSKVLLSGDFQR